MGALKGWRTLAINAAIAAGAAGLTYLAGVDWSQHVSPTLAILVMAAINAALRVVTTTPVGQGGDS